MRTAKPSPPALLSFLLLVGFCRFSLAGLRSGGLRLSRQRAEIGHLALAHALHQLLPLFAGLHQAIYLLELHTRAARDSLATRAVDHPRPGTPLRRHREGHGLDPPQPPLL